MTVLRRVSRIAAALLGAAVLAASLAGAASPRQPTEITDIVRIDVANSVAWAMDGAVSGMVVPLVLTVCAERCPQCTEVTAFFGQFPPDGRPVQLAVRSPDGTVERFGPAVRGAPGAMHSPAVAHPRDAERFALAALLPGAVISNGYESFRNRAGEARNREARETLLACLRRH